MFAIMPKPKTRLQLEMDRLVLKLGDLSPDSEEYGKIVDRVIKLDKIGQDKMPRQVSPDTLVTASANLLGIWMIINYEELHPLTSKALSFVRMR